MQGADGAAGTGGGEEGTAEEKPVPAWIMAAVMASLKRKKSIDRTPNAFYYQHFTLPYIYSYYKVGLVTGGAVAQPCVSSQWPSQWEPWR